METIRLAQFLSPINQEMTEINQKKTYKIPEYAKDYKNEWLFIRGINKKCGEFSKMIDCCKPSSLWELFYSTRATSLMKHFNYILECQKFGKIQNIRNLKLKLSVVEKIVDLRLNLYYSSHTEYEDEKFQDFFESFIVFVNNVNIKNEEDFENDVYSRDFKIYNNFLGNYTVINSDSDSELYFSSDSDSDSDIDIDIDSDIDIYAIISDSDSDSD